MKKIFQNKCRQHGIMVEKNTNKIIKNAVKHGIMVEKNTNKIIENAVKHGIKVNQKFKVSKNDIINQLTN